MKVSKAQQIAIKCSKAGCDDEKAQIHRELYIKKGWDPHPPEDFVKWWEPRDTEEESGASVGGQPDAFRVFARKDPGRWVRQSFGIQADFAWNVATYRDEYNAWRAAGSPAPPEEYVSICLSREEQQKRWSVIAAVVGL